MDDLRTRLPAILFRLGPWSPGPVSELGRSFKGYRPGITDEDLYRSTRGIWVLDSDRVKRYAYGVAVFGGVTRGVWEIDHRSWRRVRDSKGKRRLAWEGTRLSSGHAYDAFVGPAGKRIPDERPDGGPVFGTAGVIAYWPR